MIDNSTNNFFLIRNSYVWWVEIFYLKNDGRKKRSRPKVQYIYCTTYDCNSFTFCTEPTHQIFYKVILHTLRDILGGELYIFICKYKYMLKKIKFQNMTFPKLHSFFGFLKHTQYWFFLSKVAGGWAEPALCKGSVSHSGGSDPLKSVPL